MVDEHQQQSHRPPFVLYGTLGCHLCEDAARLLFDVLPVDGVTVEEIDIAHDEALMAQYGERIPVLRQRRDGRELDWPFSADDVLALD
ncbi:glutaredoxin family protein [Aquisalimonas sp.]|uniref:glutaredoxin family protein n=1 Tax=unclassified Aquisalimonas TaxID=2644645 RepID=UPI0025C4A411|nr:glutaredoxin family protein [Aquisalimonas sp.]